MVRKSAAKIKPIKAQNSEKFIKAELPPIEETFDKAKQAFINTAEVAIELAGRVDNMVNIRKAYYEYYHEDIGKKLVPREVVKNIKRIQQNTIKCYQAILDIVKTFELEEFLKEDMKDYFDPIMPKSENIEFDSELFDAFIIYGIVKPWGEKMTQLHHQMLDEKKAREEVKED